MTSSSSNSATSETAASYLASEPAALRVELLPKPTHSRVGWQGRLGWGIVAASAAALLGLTAFRSHMPAAWAWHGAVEVLMHALEGAVVGVLCDKKALVSLYRQAQQNFEPLLREVSRVVVSEMIQVRGLLANPADTLRAQLDSPLVRQVLSDFFQRAAPTRAVLRDQLQTVWGERLRLPLIQWLSELNEPRALLSAVGSTDLRAQSLLNQRVIRHALATCARGALRSSAQSKLIYELLCSVGRNLTLAQVLGLCNAEQTRVFVRKHYRNHAQARAVKWLTSVDLRAALSDGSDAEILLRRGEVRALIADCVRQAMADRARTAKLHQTLLDTWGHVVLYRAGPLDVTVARILWALKPDKLHETLTKLATAIEVSTATTTSPSTPAGEPERLQKLAQEYAVAYLDAWHEHPPRRRELVTAKLHQDIVPQLLDNLSDALFELLSHLSVEQVMRETFSADAFHRSLQGLTDWLAQPPTAAASKETQRWSAAVRVCVSAWLDAWTALPVHERQLAASALIDLAGTSITDVVATFVWQQKNALLAATKPGKRLSDLNWVQAAIEMVERLLQVPDDINDRAAKVLAARLRSMSAADFVKMLERETRPKLDSIQLNGAAFGAVFGAGVGIVMVLIEHFAN